MHGYDALASNCKLVRDQRLDVAAGLDAERTLCTCFAHSDKGDILRMRGEKTGGAPNMDPDIEATVYVDRRADEVFQGTKPSRWRSSLRCRYYEPGLSLERLSRGTRVVTALTRPGGRRWSSTEGTSED